MTARQSTSAEFSCTFCGEVFRVPRCRALSGRVKFCRAKCRHLSYAVPLEQRFLSYVGPFTPSGCMPWQGTRDSDGYGVIGEGGGGGRNLKAHRYAWERANGATAGGLCVMHSCDNPACVNVAHLSLGTNQDNTADKIAKGRGARGRSCVGHSILDEASVRLIRSRHAGGEEVRSLAKQHGVSTNCIRKVVSRLTWAYVTDL